MTTMSQQLVSYIGLIAMGNQKLAGGNMISRAKLPKGQLENEQISWFFSDFFAFIFAWLGQLPYRQGNMNAVIKLPIGQQ